MGKAPFISVVVPHLNQAALLRRCLRSLAGQAYPRDRIEVTVVDNGSAEMPEGVVGVFSGVRLVREATPGPGPARNRGAALSKGDILAFIDADCFADRDWLAVIALHLQTRGSGTIVGGDVRIAYRNPERLTTLEAYESVFAYRQKEYIEKLGFSGTGNLAVRREEFEAIGPFAGIEVAEDRDWGRRAVGAGYRIVYVPEMRVYHPARQSFTEIFAKWDRHIVHDYQDWSRDGGSRLTWLARAAAVALSPLPDLRRIIASDRISGLAPRCKAAGALMRIRLYRAGRMIRQVQNSRVEETCPTWNQPKRAR